MPEPSQPAFAPRGTSAEVEEGVRLAPKLAAGADIAAVVSDAASGEVLMLAWMNAQALALTIETGIAHFYSRSRGKLWKKGEESGNLLRVSELRTDCDQDAVWLKVTVEGHGAACHTGRRTCFYRSIPVGRPLTVDTVLNPVGDPPVFDPVSVYAQPKAGG